LEWYFTFSSPGISLWTKSNFGKLLDRRYENLHVVDALDGASFTVSRRLEIDAQSIKNAKKAQTALRFSAHRQMRCIAPVR